MIDRYLKRRREFAQQKDEDEEMHPVAKAAWQGYADYRKEMARRRVIPAWRELSVKTMAVIAAVLVVFLIAADYLSTLLG
ncbi:MAG: hypothetical protein JJ878_03495 [Alphaproteobacteria bacterium]|uniref:hypothetical protein n=1 Tax=Pacificispira sp. TaxID=2888761 RepID=UPI001B118344|nr:hypothetical protein [Alphaproteobacteria bacterium]MBO6861677.1 hypothetical protein [Alphaproteobacteria bacterium]